MTNTNKQESPSNVVSLAAHRFLRERKSADTGYALKIRKLEKADLLQELLRYDDIVKRGASDPQANLQATLRAQMLMELLESRAELTELRELAVEYKRKLAARLYAQVQNIAQSKPI